MARVAAAAKEAGSSGRRTADENCLVLFWASSTSCDLFLFSHVTLPTDTGPTTQSFWNIRGPQRFHAPWTIQCGYSVGLGHVSHLTRTCLTRD